MEGDYIVDVLNNYAINLIAEYILGQAPGTPVLEYNLFESDTTVYVDSVLSDFTLLSAPGYAPIALTAADWSVSTVSGICNATYPDITWTLTGPGAGSGIVYGHIVYDTYGGGILWAQQWDTPFTIPTNGGTVTIAPSWQDSQCATVSGIAAPFRRATRDRRANRRRK